MYEPAEVLQRVDDNLLLVLLFGGLSFGCLYVYFLETARLAFRHRCAPYTLLAVGVFLAHDGNFVLNFSDWWSTYDHWLLKGFWIALLLTTCIELVFLTAIVRFGRAEIAPSLSQRTWTMACIGGVGACIAGWAVLKDSIGDPLYLISFLLTITWCLPSISSLLLRRGVRRGMSVLQLQSYVGMALGYILLTIVVFEFDTVWWIALCLVTLAWGAVLLRAVGRAPAYDAEVGVAHRDRAAPAGAVTASAP